ncbi:hypothetical protein TraAM80_07198 [Trypanosoma rangeli]|uniref:Uncharacterized protein n=1 Tax=Trypanosoma rangeli TaxID=5698 RepID=A0A422N6P4_TRYRA|nr:uncharacterized protein TraAM80_07198 [Trypanosoma rangeli]RNF01148.1 hypothetical protein TraAM80_07198 [Trypanosoma rangeli]|eukprot:RNF01148.1 hypothetical protein TraAM80_07198 [Trypanosoma rangeli]
MAQKQILLRELANVREKLAHLIDRREFDRTIHALEAHLADPMHPTFTYGSSLLYRDAVKHNRVARNPVLCSLPAAKEYAELQKRRESLRAHENTLSPQQAAKLQERQSADASMNGEALDSQPSFSTKELF